jgi:hypothetical protein
VYALRFLMCDGRADPVASNIGREGGKRHRNGQHQLAPGRGRVDLLGLRDKRDAGPVTDVVELVEVLDAARGAIDRVDDHSRYIGIVEPLQQPLSGRMMLDSTSAVTRPVKSLLQMNMAN